MKPDWLKLQKCLPPRGPAGHTNNTIRRIMAPLLMQGRDPLSCWLTAADKAGADAVRFFPEGEGGAFSVPFTYEEIQEWVKKGQ